MGFNCSKFKWQVGGKLARLPPITNLTVDTKPNGGFFFRRGKTKLARWLQIGIPLRSIEHLPTFCQCGVGSKISYEGCANSESGSTNIVLPIAILLRRVVFLHDTQAAG